MSFTEKDLGQVFDEIEAQQSDHLVKIAKELSTEAREELPKKEFAVPGREAYPIPDLAHARNALARVSQHGTPAEREMVRKKVYAKYPELKEGFKEEHGGESPTSKENVKKEEQGGIGKEASMGVTPRQAAGAVMVGGGLGLTGMSGLFFRAAHEQKKISKGEKTNPWASKFLRIKSLPPEVQKLPPKEQAAWYSKNMQKKGELQFGNFEFAKEAQDGPLTSTMGDKGEAIGAAAGLVAGAAIGAGVAGKGGRIGGGIVGSLLGTMAGALGGRVGGNVADAVSSGSEKQGSDEKGPTFDFINAVSEQMKKEGQVPTTQQQQQTNKQPLNSIPANIAQSPETSPQEKSKILAMQQQMKSQKKVAQIPANIAQSPETSPLEKTKILAQQQKMKAQKGQPKAAGFVIGGIKIGMGEDAAADELGFSNATAESVKGDQQSAGQDLIGAKIPTATSEHLKQVANPPKGTDDFFRKKVAEEIDKVAQYMGTPALPMQQRGGPTRIIYYPMKEPGLGEKAQQFMQSHPEAYPLIGAGLGALGGGLLGQQVATPGATTAGVGLGAAGGAALGELYGHRQRQQKKRAEFIIGGEKIGAEKPGKVSEKDLKRVFEASVRRSGSPVRRKFLWDVGDVVGKKKDKEEYKPGVMVQTPVYKRAQERPRNPMMEGGDVRFTAGPIPEDVAKYLRTQATGEQVGQLAGTGVGALGGGAVGHAGGEMVGGALEQAGHPLAGRLSRILGTLGGGVAGGLAGRAVGKRVGRGIGGAVAEKLTPASQITVPFLTPSRAEFIGGRLAAAPAMEAGRTPTVAISPG